MAHTPFFPAWRHQLAPLGSRFPKTIAQLRACTLCQLETRFAATLPPGLFPKSAARQNSRERVYTQWRTFWCLLWQGLNPQASGREVVRQLQALFQLLSGPSISSEDGAYARARGRLPLTEFPKALRSTAQFADQGILPSACLQGRPVKVVDGSTLSLPDTAKNRRTYPPVECSLPTFPMMRIVVLFSLASGAILALAHGNLFTSELSLLGGLLGQLSAQDIVVGDRGFGYFSLIGLLQQQGVDFIGRTTRRLDGRKRASRLGRNDWLMVWKKNPLPSTWLSSAQWQALPSEITVRVVRGRCFQKGFRVRQVILVTTLLDPELYPAREILLAYLRRWRMEMCLDDLKTTLNLEMLRTHSPEAAQKEVYARLIAHNLIRYTMAQAAASHEAALERLSFKGTLDALRHFLNASSQIRSKTKRSQLWDQLFRTLAQDLVPERPGRREPRAVKRVKRKYQRLRHPRHIIHDRPKRHFRRTRARLRKLGLM